MTSVSYDPAKRAATLLERGLDFADAGLLFQGRHLTGEIVVVVWTWRNEARHIISMRKTHAREQECYIEHL